MADVALPGRLGRMRRTVRIAGILALAALRAEVQYRANFFMVSAGLLYQGTGFAFIWVVLSRFDEIGGWRIADIAFLYGLRLTAHGLWVVPFNRLLDLDATVRDAQFDRLLIRPLNPLIQLVTSRFWLGSFGDIIGGVVILGVATTLVDVAWSPLTVLYLCFAIFGGVTAFVLTYVLPLAFVAYLPASVLLDRTGELHVAPWLAYVAPLVGLGTFTLAYRFWRRRLRHYQSAGS